MPEVEPPQELFKMSPKKCVGLKISPEKLNDIRAERLKALGLKVSSELCKHGTDQRRIKVC